MKKLFIPFFILVSFLVGSCYYDVEEELYPYGCNATNVTYTTDVLPVLKVTCYPCHSTAAQQGGVVLEGYDNLKVFVDNGKFLSSIRHDAGAVPMPQGGAKLSECTINKIEKWIANGGAND